jgi:hypothetical protein
MFLFSSTHIQATPTKDQMETREQLKMQIKI